MRQLTRPAVVGAIVGSGVAKLALPGAVEGNLTAPTLGSGANAGEGVLMEVRRTISHKQTLNVVGLVSNDHQFYTTFGLVFGSFGTAFDPRGWGKLGPLAIAIIVGINIHAGSLVTCTPS